jgi:hypothetical protein
MTVTPVRPRASLSGKGLHAAPHFFMENFEYRSVVRG